MHLRLNKVKLNSVTARDSRAEHWTVRTVHFEKVCTPNRLFWSRTQESSNTILNAERDEESKYDGTCVCWTLTMKSKRLLQTFLYFYAFSLCTPQLPIWFSFWSPSGLLKFERSLCQIKSCQWNATDSVKLNVNFLKRHYIIRC